MRLLLNLVLLPAAMGFASKDGANALKLALADERRVIATYESVMAQFGERTPFSNIVRAEHRHAALVEEAMRRAGVPIPEGTPIDVPEFPSLREALEAGRQAEIDNIALYDRLLKLDLEPEVRAVLLKLQSDSRERHLPAFERALAGGRRGVGMGRGAIRGAGASQGRRSRHGAGNGERAGGGAQGGHRWRFGQSVR